jgi:hypothetical protein
MRVIDRAVRVGMGAVILLAWLVLGAVVAPSAEAASVDLGAIMLSKIDGYEPAPPGVGFSGPLTKEQFAEMPVDPDDVDDLTSSRLSTFARTFVTPEARIALIVAIDGKSVRGASDIERGAKIGAKDMGTRHPVAGVDHGFRVVATPDQAAGAHVQQVFFRSGQIAFFVTVADMELTPAIESEVLRIAFSQQGAVPAEISAATDDGLAYDLGYQFGRFLVYGVAGLFQAAVVVLLVVVLVKRKSPPPAPTAWAPAPAPWSPPPPAWPAPQQPWG